MTKYSKEMVTCMDTLSQLSPMELVDLAEAIEKEREARARKNEERKEKILAAINAFKELYDYCDYLELERENVMMDVYVTDIQEALEKLYYLC